MVGLHHAVGKVGVHGRDAALSSLCVADAAGPVFSVRLMLNGIQMHFEAASLRDSKALWVLANFRDAFCPGTLWQLVDPYPLLGSRLLTYRFDLIVWSLLSMCDGAEHLLRGSLVDRIELLDIRGLPAVLAGVHVACMTLL